MSDVSDYSSPPTARGRFGIWVRLFAIPLGIMSAAIMAQQGFDVRFSQNLSAALTIAGDLVGLLVSPFELVVVKPLLKALSGMGVSVELHAHWKHVFVLMWLALGSRVRGFAQTGAIGQMAIMWLFGGVFAAVAAITAGAVALDDPRIFWWPIGLLFLHDLTAGLLLPAFGSASLGAPTPFDRRRRGATLAVASVGLALLVIGSVMELPLFIRPGLPLLAAAVAYLGFAAALVGALFGKDDLVFLRTGVDILSVLSGAAIIVLLGSALS